MKTLRASSQGSGNPYDDPALQPVDALCPKHTTFGNRRASSRVFFRGFSVTVEPGSSRRTGSVQVPLRDASTMPTNVGARRGPLMRPPGVWTEIPNLTSSWLDRFPSSNAKYVRRSGAPFAGMHIRPGMSNRRKLQPASPVGCRRDGLARQCLSAAAANRLRWQGSLTHQMQNRGA